MTASQLFLSIVLFAFCESSFAQPSFECRDTETKKIQPRIVGGTTANPDDYPWQVAVSSSIGSCGGSMIGRKWVLTAAHCVDQLQTTAGLLNPGLSVRISRSDNNGRPSGESTLADRLFVHEEYDQNTLEHDIALIRVNPPFNVPLNSIVTMSTPEIDTLFTKEDNCATIVGWGLDAFNGVPSDALRQAHVPIWGKEECSSAYPGSISESQLCAGYPEGGIDSCQGDSGGPLVVRGGPLGWIQVGVVSWGEGCAQAAKPGVYTKLGSYASWIRSKVRN